MRQRGRNSHQHKKAKHFLLRWLPIPNTRGSQLWAESSCIQILRPQNLFSGEPRESIICSVSVQSEKNPRR